MGPNKGQILHEGRAKNVTCFSRRFMFLFYGKRKLFSFFLRLEQWQNFARKPLLLGSNENEGFWNLLYMNPLVGLWPNK